METTLLALILGALGWSLRNQYAHGVKIARIDTTVVTLDREVRGLRHWRHEVNQERQARSLDREFQSLDGLRPLPE